MQVSGSIPGQDGHKSFCDGREYFDYVSFHRAVKGHQFHTLKHTKQSQEQRNNISLQTLYTLELDLCPLPTDGVHSLSNYQ